LNWMRALNNSSFLTFSRASTKRTAIAQRMAPGRLAPQAYVTMRKRVYAGCKPQAIPVHDSRRGICRISFGILVGTWKIPPRCARRDDVVGRSSGRHGDALRITWDAQRKGTSTRLQILPSVISIIRIRIILIY